ncbi:DUF262 domain-containing protein [Aliarcobacter butzleri]|uniref:DUF262 domain-containing protein n=1 Tax=Aliarcobacter butzleri TaxID=28197 RepID=UPI0002295717|nr:DUF262 domain-containing protein [Aliarcobacter butzleri]BAK70524.1 conserved hypothetical protein [Aliarcobacter butzleri ED-1]
MTKDVKVFVNSFDEFISNLPFQLAIDSYQRPYVWGEGKVNELIDDLKEYLHNPKSLSYYMGTILLHKKTNDKNQTKYYIIDGQQRLTTLMILYFVHFNNLPKNTSLTYNSPVSVKYIQEVKSKFINNQTIFKNHMNDLFNKISFTFVITNSEDLAFTFFDTQNNRGVKLSTTDLLKAYHLRAIDGNSKEELQIKYAKEWETIQRQESILPTSYDFVSQLYEKFIYRVRNWTGQKNIIKENREQIIKEFQTDTLSTKDNLVNLYNNINNQKYLNIRFEDNKMVQNFTKELYNKNSIDLPFTLRQPIDKGMGFFLFTKKYAEILDYIFIQNEKDIQDKNILEFRKFYDKVYMHLSIYLKELFVISILIFYDKFKSNKLLEFVLWLDYNLGAIRFEKTYVFEQAPIKFLKESSLNLFDLISFSFRPEEVINYLKSEGKKISIYEKENIKPNEGVQGRYKASVLKYFEKEFKEEKLNYLKDREYWNDYKIKGLNG